MSQALTKPSSIFRRCLLATFLLGSSSIHASFIEATVGTAVVNDATATYHNPAALTLLKNPQMVALSSIAYLQTQFDGQATNVATGLTQSGSSKTATHYYLPSIYLGVPGNSQMVAGIAVVANDFNRSIENQSVLKYVQSDNHIQDVDLVYSLGYKINDFIAIGAGAAFSRAKFLLQPTFNLPSLNIPDSQARNESSATSWAGDVGILIKPNATTLIGFNHRSALRYHLRGSSVFNGTTTIVSNNYHSKFFTPARSILSVSHFVTPKLGFVGTLTYIQWDIFKDINIYGIATPNGITNATVHYHFRNAWLVTLGTHYRMTPEWIVRFAGTYNQAPANNRLQIASGDSIILGVSTAYQIFKNITLDGSYAHAFIKDTKVNITTGRNFIQGVNKGVRDAISLKITYNIL